MKYLACILPAVMLLSLVCGVIKKVDVYESFASGVKQTIELVSGIFPYIATVLVMTELCKGSGVDKIVIKTLSPVFEFLHIPEELSELMLLKPFSGSGSLAVLSQIIERHGADSYLARCAACIYASSETVFYLSAVYTSACKKNGVGLAVAASVTANVLSASLGCFLCKIM